MSKRDLLFLGKPLPSGGLTNERILAADCPLAFFDPKNKSRLLAEDLAKEMLDEEGTFSEADRPVRMRLVVHLLRGLSDRKACRRLNRDHRIAVAGWMLSKIYGT